MGLTFCANQLAHLGLFVKKMSSKFSLGGRNSRRSRFKKQF